MMTIHRLMTNICFTFQKYCIIFVSVCIGFTFYKDATSRLVCECDMFVIDNIRSKCMTQFMERKITNLTCILLSCPQTESAFQKYYISTGMCTEFDASDHNFITLFYLFIYLFSNSNLWNGMFTHHKNGLKCFI